MFQRKLRILTVLWCAGLLVVGLKVAYLQLLCGDAYRNLAQRQPIRERIIPTSRGSILDARGRLLAGDQPSYELCVRPSLFEKWDTDDQQRWLTQLAAQLGQTPAELEDAYAELRRSMEQRAARPGLSPKAVKVELAWIRRRHQPLLVSLDFAEVARLETWRDTLPRPPGKDDPLDVRMTSRRHYPYGNSACHVIGYLTRINADEAPGLRRVHRELAQAYAEVDPELFRDPFLRSYLPDESKGRRGLERTKEAALRGRRGVLREIVDAGGWTKQVLFSYRPERGADIKTTLDIDLQRVAEDALGDQQGAAVILDVHTGAVLALASSPRFDLEHFSQDFHRIMKEDRDFRNAHVPGYLRPRPLVHRAIQETYPPGSIFKLVTALAGLRCGSLSTRSEYECRGSMAIGGQAKLCMGHHGLLDLRGAIQRSCNIYFYQAALDTPRAELLRTARELGFGSPTGIDLPGEAAGRLPQLVSDGAVANFAIGQGDVGVTPLQVAVMMAAIANGGAVVRPHLVAPVGAQPALRRLDVPASALKVVREGMRDVVHRPGGTAHKYVHLAGLTIAGKTGTAEVEGVPLNHAWFGGFAPYEDPRIAFAVVVEWTEGQGGDTAAPVAASILSRLRFGAPRGAVRRPTSSAREGRRAS